MKLTKTQIEILMHRIDADVIPGVLADTEELNITEVEAEEAQKRIEMFIQSGQIPMNSLTRVEKEVLKDAMDGSTFFACAESGLNDGMIKTQKVSALNRSADELEHKWFLETNENISIPRD